MQTVRRPTGREYAFVEFSSPQAARQVMESCACSSASSSAGGSAMVLQGSALQVGWAKGRPAAPTHSGGIPDCWFCLASPSVKVHLVLSVSEHAYVALPRGGLCDAHLLISPIDCVPSRAHLSADAKKDFGRYEAAVQQLYLAQNCAMLRFERTIRTKSRDHMQEHCVPIPLSLVPQALSIFMKQVTAHELKFSEISDDRDADEVVLTMEGGPYQEYFYISIPVGTCDTPTMRRFVYVHEGVVEVSSSGEGEGEGGRGRKDRFPLTFGMIVAAHILGRPERSNWKHCLQTDEEEHQLADRVRASFEPYDFTLLS